MKKLFNKEQLIYSVWFRGAIILIIIGVLSFIMNLVSNHSEYTIIDELQKAEVAIINDDLELALSLYEEADAQSGSDQTKALITSVKKLIDSKYNYTKAQVAEKENKLELAYEYYLEVTKEDTVRYSKAQSAKKEVAYEIVNDLMDEAKKLYTQQLYPLVIGQLTKALNYDVRVNELNEHLENANNAFYHNAMDKAKRNYHEYLDNEYLFDSFKQDLLYANLFATSDEQRDQLESLEEMLYLDAITHYTSELEVFKEAEDATEAIKYAKMILAMDEDNEEALAYLESVEKIN